MIKGVLFDMDGVLVDSEEFIFGAIKMMFAEHGIQIQREDSFPFIGTGEDKYITGIGKKNGFAVEINRDKARTYQIYEAITVGKLKSLPGVYEFIELCLSKNLKIAVASSADKVKILINLREIGLSVDKFDSIICGQDVERKKPFPDIYLLAAEKIGLYANECLVVEDAISGIASGKAAGAKCLGITTSFKAEQLAEADWICKDLCNVPVEAIDW